jgi:GxxExxY protein
MVPTEPQIAQRLMDDKRVRDPRTYAIIGAARRVQSLLGSGFLERVYQDALELEFGRRDVPHHREVEVPIFYDGMRLRSAYRADFVCFENILVELKSQEALGPADEAQALHYLKGTNLELALLINFGAPSLEFRRFAWGWRHVHATSVQSVVQAGA